MKENNKHLAKHVAAWDGRIINLQLKTSLGFKRSPYLGNVAWKRLTRVLRLFSLTPKLYLYRMKSRAILTQKENNFILLQ